MEQKKEKKENKETHKQSPFIIIICSSLSLLFSLTLLILWCINVGGFDVVSLDSFVAVIVALLAVAVTFVLGWQIFNTIELKNKIQELQQLKKLSEEQFNSQKTEIYQLSQKTNHLINLIWAEDALEKGNFVGAFRYYIISLQSTLSLSSGPMNVNIISKLMKKSSEKLKKGDELEEEFYSQVIEANDAITKLSDYQLIKEWYDPAYQRFKELVSKA